MKFALVFTVIALGAFALIVTMALSPAEVEITNMGTLNASGVVLNNQSNFSYWDKMVGAWPFLAIMFMACLVGFGVYKAIKH